MLSPFTRRFVRCSLFLLALLVPLAAGCSSKKGKAVVKGTVTFNGKLLKAGIVSFQTADNRIGTGRIETNGEYTILDAPIGDAKITVIMPVAPQAMPKAPKDMSMPAEMIPKDSGAPPVNPKDLIPLPQKYATIETTDLKHTVTPGESKYDITLTP